MAIGDCIHVNKFMLLAGWDVRIVKNCDRGLENAARGHSFSLYGPTLSRSVTCSSFFFRDKLAHKLKVGLFTVRNFVIESTYEPCINHL